MKSEAAPSSTPETFAGTKFYWLICIAIMALCVSRLLPVVVGQLLAPVDLISESTNLATIKALQEGKNVYDPQVYLQPPFTLTMYTPAYHYLVSVLPASDQNPFLTGRLVAMICMLAAATALLLVEPEKPGVFLGLTGVGVFLLVWPVTANTAFLSNNSAALCFSALAVVAAARSRGAVRWIVLSALFCTLAVASKQSFGAATIACVLFFFFSDRRACRWFLACAGVFLAVFCLGGYWAWGHGFWYSVVEAVLQPMDMLHFTRALGQVCQQPSFFPVFGACLAGAMVAAFQGAQFRASPYGYYALASWIVLLATLGKLGSSSHYFLEPCLASLMFAVSYCKSSTPPLWKRRAGLWVGGVLGALILIDVKISRPEDYSFLMDQEALERRIETQSLRNQALAAIHPNPRILNLASALLAGELPGEVSIKDPYLYYLLWENDQLSEESLVQALNARYFDVVVVSREFVVGLAQARLHEGRWPRILNSIYENYPLVREGPDVVFLVPKDTP